MYTYSFLWRGIKVYKKKHGVKYQLRVLGKGSVHCCQTSSNIQSFETTSNWTILWNFILFFHMKPFDAQYYVHSKFRTPCMLISYSNHDVALFCFYTMYCTFTIPNMKYNILLLTMSIYNNYLSWNDLDAATIHWYY